MDETPPLTAGDRLFRTAHPGASILPFDSTDVPYSTLYHEAGDDLLAKAASQRVSSFFLFPALYCYRHAVEIALKDIIALWDRIQRREPEVRRHHKLSTLWPLARPAFEDAWPEGDPEVLDALRNLISELDVVDPDGWHFRYGVDRKGRGRELPPELEGVDLSNLALVMRNLIWTLSGTATMLEEYMGHRADQECGYA